MEPIEFICFKCKHFREYKGGCDAFPDGIPEEITNSSNDHKKPIEGQQNNILFEPINKED